MALTLSRNDKDFLYRKVCHFDFKRYNVERILVAFLARLKHDGYTSRVVRNLDLTVEDLTNELIGMEERFIGFKEHREVAQRWVETHLVDVVNRGKPSAALASPRPLHGYVYRFRNLKVSRSYNGDQQLYDMLYSAGNEGRKALGALKQFFFLDEDALTGRSKSGIMLDVETQALSSLKDQVSRDVRDEKSRESDFRPLCETAARILAEDVLRVLAYRDFVPRTVMVEYLITLVGLHLGLYLLRLLNVLPRLVAAQGNPDSCGCSRGVCRSQARLVVDIAGLPKTTMAKLAERSTALHVARILGFVRANFTAKKLSEFAGQLRKTGGQNQDSLRDVLRLASSGFEASREGFFQARLTNVMEDGEDSLPPELEELLRLAPTNMDKYIELLVHERSGFHRKYIIEAIDALFFKNTAAALIAQPRGKASQRRWVLGGRLLEVLLQVVMLKPGGPLGFHTAPLRFTELLDALKERYGLYIDAVPSDGFEEATLEERAALRGNVDAFKVRLRELGFFTDLSDASSTQFVTPRYVVEKDFATSRGAA